MKYDRGTERRQETDPSGKKGAITVNYYSVHIETAGGYFLSDLGLPKCASFNALLQQANLDVYEFYAFALLNLY
jgi:hypothetical protein